MFLVPGQDWQQRQAPQRPGTMFLFVYVCTQHESFFQQSTWTFSCLYILCVCVCFFWEDDSGRYITTRNVHVSNHRGFPPERQAHIQSLTWKDFLLIGCRTVSCFWKPAFLDYRYLWTFTVFGKDVFFVFLVVCVSILCLPLSPGETSVEKNTCWLYMLPKCLKRRRDRRVKSYFGNLSDSQGWGDFCKLCFLEVTRSYSKYIFIYFCRWVSLQHMGNKCG